jgi:hypothetical protein
MRRSKSAWLAGIFAIVFFAGAQDPPPEQTTVGTVYPRGIMTPTNQVLAPNGRRVSFNTAIGDVVVSPNLDQVAVVLDRETWLYSAGGDFIRTLPLGLTSIMGAAYSPDGAKLAVT